MASKGTINCGANSNSGKTTMKINDTVSFKNTSSKKKIDLKLPSIFKSQPANPIVVGKGSTNNKVGPYTVKAGVSKKDYEYSWIDHDSPAVGTRIGTISVED